MTDLPDEAETDVVRGPKPFGAERRVVVEKHHTGGDTTLSIHPDNGGGRQSLTEEEAANLAVDLMTAVSDGTADKSHGAVAEGDHVRYGTPTAQTKATPDRARGLAVDLVEAANEASGGEPPDGGDDVHVHAKGPGKDVERTLGPGEQVAIDGVQRVLVTSHDHGERERNRDPYQSRVADFQDAIAEETGADYLSVLPAHVDPDEAMGTHVPQQPARLRDEVKGAIAERNRLFWAAFLNEEAGEVASALTSGEPPEDFEEEVADVLIVAFGIADAFGFDMSAAFAEKMKENEAKPHRQEGTGKLPDAAREGWSE